MKYSKSAIWELTYPITISFVVAVISIIFSKNYCLDFNGLVNASLNVFGILIGFLITVLTIINSIENSYTRELKKDESYRLLSVYLKHSIWGCFLSIVVGISHIFFFKTLITVVQNGANALFVLSFVFALLSSYRFLKIFLKLSLKK
ncbi:hypothetical protein [Aquimarina algiphila]|uniref:hypothetical protein n=1 Tax=Aquimarina algiphila TaxID=2047982 RepID=UPI00232DE85B|nr:hypothetical protein [Aquimarina algiphila]